MQEIQRVSANLDNKEQGEIPLRAVSNLLRPRDVLNKPSLTTTIQNGDTNDTRWSPLSTSEGFTNSGGTYSLASAQTGNSMETCRAARDTAASAASADVKHS
jgi:hypothetical protein